MDSETDRTLKDRLTVLLGLNDLLLERAYGPLTPKQEQVLKDLRHTAMDVWVLLGHGNTHGCA